MLNDLLLLSGVDIPFIEAQISIHQPTLKEISYIGEESFFIGSEILTFNKNILSDKDKTVLEDKDDFEIFMSIMNNLNPSIQKNRISALMVLSIIFPEYQIKIEKKYINFYKEGEDAHQLNKENFNIFKIIISEMFCLNQKNKDERNYNPNGSKAKQIAEKLKKRREKLQKIKGEENKKIALLSRYISILSTGEKLDFQSLFNCTVYQLFDKFNRFKLKQDFDIWVKSKLAGAQDIEDAEDWMKDIHE